jgi:lipopolysaccharide biosynthesis glycosyltransferase
MLNPVLAGNWLELPYTYNFFSHLLYLEKFPPVKERHRSFLRERSQLYSKAKVFHFAGQPKPWHHWSTDPSASLWLRALWKSGWLDLHSAIKWIVYWLPRRIVVRVKLACGLLERRESTASLPNY